MNWKKKQNESIYYLKGKNVDRGTHATERIRLYNNITKMSFNPYFPEPSLKGLSKIKCILLFSLFFLASWECFIKEPLRAS